MQIRRLSSTEELFEAADGDFLVRANVPAGAVPGGLAWAAEDGTFGYVGTDGTRDKLGWLDVIGDPGTAGELLRVALEELDGLPLGFSVPRGTEFDRTGLRGELEAWDFMVWDTSVPGTVLEKQDGEELVVALMPGAEVDAEIAAFLAEANPHHSTKPGWDGIELWGGIRSAETGGLLAVGALCHRENGLPWLASIGTHPDVRGRGFGAAVSAWLTRRGAWGASGDPGKPGKSGESGGGVCTLAHYAPNEPARRIYTRLGYRTTHAMISGWYSAPDGDAASDAAEHLRSDPTETVSA